MSMSDTEDMLTRLRSLKPAVRTRYKAKEISVFGSLVRGEQGSGSDIDLLVEFEEDADLFDLMGLILHLEQELNRKVDVVPKRALRAELRESVLQEAVTL